MIVTMVTTGKMMKKITRYWETTPKKREKEAWKIYRTYICIGAPKELNLDMLSRKVVIVMHMTHFKLEVMILCQGVSKILTANRI